MASARAPGDPSRRPSLDRVRLIVYPVLVLLGLLALAARTGWLNTEANAGKSGYIYLRGFTDEQEPIAVTLDRGGRINALHVQLIGLCENGGRYPVGWSPNSPRIPFRPDASGTVAREYGEQRSAEGIVSRTVVWTTARVESAGQIGGQNVTGDARYQTTFRYPDGRRLRCDSGYVHWAVNRTGAANGAKSTGAPGSFPLVSSLAGEAPPAQLQFAASVDDICGVTYNEDLVRELRRKREHEALMSQREAAIADHERQYVTISKLGPAPSAANLYRAWLANMRERIRLERLALRQRIQETPQRSEMTLAEASFMKIQGDSFGQEFGLRVCSSNGPLRHMIGRFARPAVELATFSHPPSRPDARTARRPILGDS